MTEGEERKVTLAKARRSSPSVDRNVRGENVHSLASQQRPASIECTELAIQPQPIRRSNQPAANPMRDRDGSAHADSRHSRPQQFDSIRQAAGAMAHDWRTPAHCISATEDICCFRARLLGNGKLSVFKRRPLAPQSRRP